MIWIFVFLFPMLTAFLTAFFHFGKRNSGLFFMLATLPSLWLSLTENSGLSMDWLLLGTNFSLDEPRRIILLMTAMLWAVSGLFSASYLKDDPRKSEFSFYYGLTMAGNFGLLISSDIISFYTFFALMTFASYGLVIHNRNTKADYAAKVYLIMAILGELFIINAMFLAVHISDSILLVDIPKAIATSSNGSIIFLLALIGFGVKAGAIPLYFWLPLAHPAAPAPASVVLSGAMIKAGLVGWIHFSPIGLVTWEVISIVIVSLGIASALGAAIIGIFQIDPKTNLAYSSISQMGLMTIFPGIGLMGNISADLLLPAIALFAFNHGLAKGILFMGTTLPEKVGGSGRIIMWLGLGLSALSIAGAPLTGGLWTKYILKKLLVESNIPGLEIFSVLLIFSSFTTTLLLCRFLYLLSKINSPKTFNIPGIFLPWIFLLLLGAGGWWTTSPLLLSDELKIHISDTNPITYILWNVNYTATGAFPILLGIILFLFVLNSKYNIISKLPQEKPIIPPGDLLYIIQYVINVFMIYLQKGIALLQIYAQSVDSVEKIIYRILDNKKIRKYSQNIEILLRQWEFIGIFFFIVFLILFMALQ